MPRLRQVADSRVPRRVSLAHSHAECGSPARSLRGRSSAMVVTLRPIPGIPLVRPRDDLAELLILACERQAMSRKEGDILVVAQKVVSKAEGRYIDLETVVPSARAQSLAAEVEKDPRLVEVILGESGRVVRRRPGILIVEHRLGFVMANAGVDRSNVDPEAGAEPVLLLPRDPDGSA